MTNPSNTCARCGFVFPYGAETPRLCHQCYTTPASANQCDGCREGLPLTDGLHYRDGKPWIGCTASRYASAPHNPTEAR